MVFRNSIFKQLLRKPNKVEYSKSPFLIDKPLEDGEDDLFGRKVFAKGLAEKIQSKINDEDTGALAVGINGAWGSGKTSFANLIKNHINKQNRIIIDFNPWRSSSPQKIIEDFFELLITELSLYDPNLSNSISKYAKTLTKIDENIITKSIDNLSSFFFDEISKNEYYDAINNSISKIAKQMIIFIDDLDRLDKKEIIEVLRIVRNTANFNNVVYVISYDKEYVLEAVKDINPHNYKYFLEKIFQFEFLLTKFDAKILRDNLRASLKNQFNDYDFTLINKAIDKTVSRGEYLTEWFIKSQRDVIRFSNALIFEIENIRMEVHPMDFFYLQLLKLKHPLIHQYLYNYKIYFFIVDDNILKFRTNTQEDLDNSFYITLGMLDSTVREPNKAEKSETILFNEFVVNSIFFENIDRIEKQIIIKLVEELLKIKNSEDVRLSLSKSFVFDNNFEKYFTYSILSSDISKFEFEHIRKEEWNFYEAALDNWINQGRLNQLEFLLALIKDFSGIDEWENHLKAVLKIAKMYFIENKPFGKVDYKLIFDVINYPVKFRNTVLLFDTKEEYRKLIYELFENAPSPYIFEGNILKAALSDVREFPLTRTEIEKLTLNYLKEYITKVHRITADLYRIRQNCIQVDSSTGEVITEEANEIFKVHFKKYLTACDLGKFIRQTSPDSEYYQLEKEEWSFFFNTIEELLEWINTSENLQDSADCKNEMIDFINEIIKNNYRPVKFNFNFITPIRWRSMDSQFQKPETRNDQATLADTFPDE